MAGAGEGPMGLCQWLWPGLRLYACDPGPWSWLKPISPGQTWSIGEGHNYQCLSCQYELGYEFIRGR